MAQGVYPVTRDPRRPDTYMFSFRDRQGRRHFRKGFDTKKAAEAARHQLEQELRDNTYIAPKDIPTFGTIADAWLSSKSTHRPSSQSQWKVHIDHLFNPGLGFNLRTTKINEVDVQAIEKVRDELRKKLSPTTVNKILTTAAAIFRRAMRLYPILKSNPAALAERLRVNSGSIDERDVLSPDEVKKLLAHADAGFGYTLLLMAILTGLRHDELLALMWGDIELADNGGRLYVRRSLSWAKAPSETDYKPRFFEPKTKASRRTLPLPIELVQQLRVWKLQCPPSELGLVFPTELGKPAHRTNVLRRYLYPALRRAQLRQVDMHSLRHTFASALIAAGAPVTEVQYLLGHSNPTTTLRVYSHWFKKVETSAVSNLAKSLGVGAAPTRLVESE